MMLNGTRRIHRSALSAAAAVGVIGAIVGGAGRADAGTATVTVSNSQVGKTLQYVGYNSGHYMPGSNTSAWVEYSNVNAFRVWAASSYYEPNVGGSADDNSVWGDGVTSLSSFNARKTALRADPLNPTYINWDGNGAKLGFNYYFENLTQPGTNALKLNYTLGELRDRNIHVIQQTTRSAAGGPITGASDWGGKWEQWQHYYAMAFHSARDYGVSQYQMYNEPNGDSNTNLTDYNIRLKLAADAVRSAVSDVNRLYGKSLVADIAAPVSAGGSTRVDDWGKAALQDIRTDYQGNTVNYDIFNTYAAQVYGQTGSGFGNEVAGIKSKIPLYHAGGTAAGQAMPVIFSEWNRFTSNNYATRTETLETPYVFTDIGSSFVNAMAAGAQSLYSFKFSQTLWTPTGASAKEPQKTGFFYVGDGGTYDITGATHSSGVVRLFAKGFTDERARLGANVSTAINNYDLATSYDSTRQNYYVFGVNRNDAESHTLTFDLSTWNVQPGTMVSVEEVSGLHNGEVTQLMAVPANRKIVLTQPSRSVWLLTVPGGAAQAAMKIGPSADARVRNADPGNTTGYATANYGSLTTARVGRTADSARYDYATYLKFDVGAAKASNVNRAILQITGHTTADDNSTQSVLFHVYALSNDAWTENGITWSNAPNLSSIDAKLTGVGASAWPVGQLTFTGATDQTVGIDLTQFLLEHPGQFDDGKLSFALVREERFAGDAESVASFVEMYTREAGSALAPQLTLFVPEPGGLAVVAGAGLLLGRRRRKLQG